MLSKFSKLHLESQFCELLHFKKSKEILKSFNPKGGGVGPKVPGGFSIGCHFSQDDAMVTKILDFIHIHPK